MADIVDTFIARLRSEGEADIRKAQAAVNAFAAAQDKATASSDKAAAANRNVAESANVVSITDEKITRAKRTTTNELERWINRMDRGSRVMQTYRNDLARLQRMEEENVGTKEQRAFAEALVTRRMEEGTAATHRATVATNDNTRAMAAGTKSVGALNSAVTSFGFQVNDVATGLLSGASPFTIAAQQAGQFAQAFAQGGGPTAVLSAFGRTLAGLITPMRLVVAGAVALGAGLAAVLSRASENAAMIRQLDATLRGVGPASAMTSEGLQKVVYDLRAIGVAAKDAVNAVRDVANNPALNRANASAVSQITELGTNVGARLGIGNVAGIEKVNAALAGGVEEMVKLGLATRSLSTDQATAILVEADRGKGVAALNKAIALMRGELDKERESVISAAEAMKNTLGGAWDEMMNKASKNSWIVQANENLVTLTQNLTHLISVGSVPPNSLLAQIMGIPVTGTVPTWKPTPGAAASAPIPGLASVSASNAKIEQLIPEFASRLDAWVASLSEADRKLVKITSGFAEGGHAADSNHYRGTSVDIKNLSEAARAALKDFKLSVGVRHPEHDHVEPAEIPSVASGATKEARIAASKAFARGTTVEAEAAKEAADAEVKHKVAIDAANRARLDAVRLAALTGAEQQAQTAYTQKYNEVLKATENETYAAEQANIAFNETREKAVAAAEAAAQVEDKKTAGITKTTEALKVSEAAGYEAAAAEEARIKVDDRGGNVAREKALILNASAAAAIQAGEKQLAAQKPQIAATEKLAAETAKGTAAEHAQQLQNEASAMTQDALAKAEASRNPILIAQAKALTDNTIAQVKRNDAAKQELELNQQINQRTNQVAVLELTAKLQGQTTEEIARQVALLQAKQDLDARGITNGMAIWDATMKNVEALEQAKIKTAEAERGQKRLEDAVKSAADTVATDLSQAMGDAFSGKKVTDWGATVKSTITSIIQSIASSAIIKPLIGTVLAGLGFGNLAKDFGSIGSTISGIENLFGADTGTDFGGGGEIDVSESGGFLSKLFSSGGSLGFLGDLGRTSILGSSTTIGSAFTGIGLGFGAGSLLNTLTGGNRTTGTIGSGLGSLAGTAIGSLFGGPIVGGLLGGLGGGLLGGLFGGSKKPNQASGGYINLATGEITGARSGGNAENDKTAIAIGKALSDTVVKLLKLPGATLPAGTLGVEAGSRDGIKLSYAGQTFKFADASAAIAGGLVALRDNLTGVSDTVQKVLHGISDIDELDAALTFAETYDKIAEAADNAFADIEDKTIGPFATAFDEINTIFDELIAQAEKFGLSLDPVNEALAEATKRLNDDFSKAVDRAFNDASESGFLNDIADIIEGYKSMAADADTIGASRAVTDKLNQTANKEIAAVLDTLTGAELDQVLAEFGDLAITDLPALATAARDVAVAAEEAADALERSTAAYQIQQDYDTAGGEGFLAQLRDLDKARKETLDTIADLKLDDSLKALAAETEHRAALTILQELTNEQLETARDLLEDLNPAFGAWVDEAKDLVKVAKAAADAEEAHTAALAAGIRIRQYLNAQETTEELNSPADRLASARSQFATQLGLAQGGDVKALENITGAADELKQAIIAWFASSAPGSQEWEEAKAALALLPGVPSADEKSTNAIITAIEESAETTSTATTTAASASAKQIIDVAISTNAKIVDNARVAASDIIAETGESSYRIVASTIESSNAIVKNGIESSARIAGATTTSLEFTTAATRDVAVAAAATTAAVRISTSTAEGGTLALLASNAANAETLIAGSQEDTRALLAQQEANAAELIAANVAQSAALIDQNELNAAATVTATNTTAASIVAGNTSTAQKIIDTATANTEAVRVTANDNTNNLIWTANATSKEVAARNEAAAHALLLKTEEGTYTTAGTVAAWSKLVLDYNWLASQNIWETVAAWGAAIAGAVREWGNATLSSIGYWGQADINYQVWAGNSIVNTVAAGTNAITNSIYAASTTTIAAVYGAASNDIAATYSNGNAIIGAISSMSISNTAATYSSANSIVAQVYAAGSSAAVYAVGYQIDLEIYNMSNRMAGYLALVCNRIERSNDLLQALANLLVAGLDQIDSELATINDNNGANTRAIVNAIG